LHHNDRDGSSDDHDSATTEPVRRRGDRGPGRLSDNDDHGATDNDLTADDDDTAMRRTLPDNDDDDDGNATTTTDDDTSPDNHGSPDVSR
jgi:hypothetical protein